MTLANPICASITTDFHLSTEVLASCDKYYILYWNSRFLYTQVLRSPRIIRESIAYIPIFQEGLSLEELGKHPDNQVRLSFRKIRGHRTGYVIISPCPAISTTCPKKLTERN